MSDLNKNMCQSLTDKRKRPVIALKVEVVAGTATRYYGPARKHINYRCCVGLCRTDHKVDEVLLLLAFAFSFQPLEVELES